MVITFWLICSIIGGVVFTMSVSSMVISYNLQDSLMLIFSTITAGIFLPAMLFSVSMIIVNVVDEKKKKELKKNKDG